jgi:hypothetical protein
MLIATRNIALCASNIWENELKTIILVHRTLNPSCKSYFNCGASVFLFIETARRVHANIQVLCCSLWESVFKLRKEKSIPKH